MERLNNGTTGNGSNGAAGPLFAPDSTPSEESEVRPLADRMRPTTIEQLVGQSHLTGKKGALRPLLDEGRLHSMIFWGDPGVGKTTLARLLAGLSDADFIQLSAVASGVADIRRTIDRARTALKTGRRTVLFIDEIHRFHKGQQDALLHSVEEGTLILIGATTENPSFEVIPPLLSRCRVYRFQPLTHEELDQLLARALSEDEELAAAETTFDDNARKALLELSLGDAREMLNLVERCAERARHEGKKHIDLKLLERVASQALSRYDKSGDRHYDTISAFIKCVRNSDPDAAIYWMARMLKAGEDPLFIARRLVILASEDIGNANPNGLLLAQAAFDAVHQIGMPEAKIILAQVTTYLAASPKSNAAYKAINEAMELVSKGVQPPVPLHLRNPVTGLMKAEGYGDGYRYAHDELDTVSPMPGLPPELEGKRFYRPTSHGSEAQIAKRLEELRRFKEEAKARDKAKDKKSGQS